MCRPSPLSAIAAKSGVLSVAHVLLSVPPPPYPHPYPYPYPYPHPHPTLPPPPGVFQGATSSSPSTARPSPTRPGRYRQARASAKRVAIDVLCTTAATLAALAPYVMDTILSVRLRGDIKEYLVRWSPSARRTWASLDELMGADGMEMWEHFDPPPKLEIAIGAARAA